MAQGDFTRGLSVGSNIIGDAADLAEKREQFIRRIALDQAIEERTAENQKAQLGLEGQRVGFEGQNVDLRRKEYEAQQAAVQRQLAGSDALAGAISQPATTQGIGL